MKFLHITSVLEIQEICKLNYQVISEVKTVVSDKQFMFVKSTE